MKYLLLAILLAVVVPRSQQKTSPCPAVFTYDEKEDTSDTWYGTLRLKTNVPLHGIFVDVIFDGQVYVFGAYFKDVTTKDNLRFHIEDKTYRLNSVETLILKFYVKHSEYGRAPTIRQVRFNGQNICVDVPTVRPATNDRHHIKPIATNSYDKPIVYPDDPVRRENRPNKFADVPNVSHESRPSVAENPDEYDPIQDPNIWKKPTTEASTSRPIRQPAPSYENSRGNNYYANSRTPPPRADDHYQSDRTTTTEATYYQGDHRQHNSRSTTKKPSYFQGDYAFIQPLETSTL